MIHYYYIDISQHHLTTIQLTYSTDCYKLQDQHSVIYIFKIYQFGDICSPSITERTPEFGNHLHRAICALANSMYDGV